MLAMILENIFLIAIIVLAIVVVWKISKTVIHMVIGFILLVGIGLGVWYVYRLGFPEIARDSGYLVVFINGFKVLLERIKEAVL